MKDYTEIDKLFRTTDWRKIAKARKLIQKQYLATDDPKLHFIASFIDQLREIAVETYGKKLSEVYPNATAAHLVSIALDREKASDKIAKSFFKAQDKKRKEDGN